MGVTKQREFAPDPAPANNHSHTGTPHAPGCTTCLVRTTDSANAARSGVHGGMRRHLVTVPGIVHSDGEPHEFHCATRHFICHKVPEKLLCQPGVDFDHPIQIASMASMGSPASNAPQANAPSFASQETDAWKAVQDEGPAAAVPAGEDTAACADDTLPLPENVPTNSGATLTEMPTADEPTKAKPAWATGSVHSGTCPRAGDSDACQGSGKLIDTELKEKTASGLFLHFCSVSCWETVVIKASNLKDSGLKLTTHEFILFIAIRLFISCYAVGDVRQWFTSSGPSAKGAPFRLNRLMSDRRFVRITTALAFSVSAAQAHAMPSMRSNSSSRRGTPTWKPAGPRAGSFAWTREWRAQTGVHGKRTCNHLITS